MISTWLAQHALWISACTTFASIIELIFFRRFYVLKDSLHNYGVFIVTAVLSQVTNIFVPALLLTALNLSFFKAIEETLPMFVLAFLFYDLCDFLKHYAEHKVRILWVVHSVHHSSNHYNFSTALRTGPFQSLYSFVFMMPLAFVGFQAQTIIYAVLMHKVVDFFFHTQAVGKLPLVEKIFNSPSLHKVHHASNPEYIDKNFGSFLIIWDRLIGTFAEEKSEVNFGLVKPLQNPTFKETMFHELGNWWHDLMAEKTLTGKLFVTFASPEAVAQRREKSMVRENVESAKAS